MNARTAVVTLSLLTLQLIVPAPSAGRDGIGETDSPGPDPAACVEPPAPGIGGFGEAPPAGVVVYRDPGTGRLAPAPAGTVLRLHALVAERIDERAADRPLVEVPVAAAPGGVRVRLGGRFQTLVISRWDGAGRAATVCGAPVVGGVEVAEEVEE